MIQRSDNDFAKVLYYYGLIQDNVCAKLKIICPFHDDYKPSMLIDLENERYYCFGCQRKGNVDDFIQEVEECSGIQALKKKAEILNNRVLNKLNIFYQPKQNKKQLLRYAKLYYDTLDDTNFDNGTQAEQYILNRGFNQKTLIKYGIRENDCFPHSIIAPILENGKFKGYVLRAIIDNDRKYLYNKGFNRSTTLCGNYFKDWVVICEGYFDYLKLCQAGLTNSVAILGWKATDYQISKLQTITNKVVSALDNTTTGRQGTQYLQQYFDVVRFRFPDSCKDPGDLDKFQMRKSICDTKRSIEAYERKKKHS